MNATKNNRATATRWSTATAKVTDVQPRYISFCVIDVEPCVDVLANPNCA